MRCGRAGRARRYDTKRSRRRPHGRRSSPVGTAADQGRAPACAPCDGGEAPGRGAVDPRRTPWPVAHHGVVRPRDPCSGGVRRSPKKSRATESRDVPTPVGTRREQPVTDPGPGATLLVEAPVVERVLSAALRRGGEFAEVFAEDRQRDVRRPRRRPGGGAVVGAGPGGGHSGRGRGDDRLRPHRRPVRGGPAGRGRGGGGGGPARWRGAGWWPSSSARRAAAQRGGRAARGRRQEPRKIELLQRADDAARAAGGAVRQVSASYGDSRRRDPGGQQRRRPGVRRPGARPASACRAWPWATPACRRVTSRRRSRSASSSSTTVDVDELAATRGRRALIEAGAPGRRPSGEVPLVLASGSGGILFHEACGHGLEADHIVKDASVLRRPGRRAGGEPARHPGRRRHHRARVGHLRHRRRRPPRPAQRADRGRGAHRLHVGLAAGPQGGPAARRATAGARATATCPWSG